MVWCVQASCVIWGLLNYAGWQLMKSQAVADAHGWSRCVANQAHDSLAGRAYEWERMPLGIDQGIGAVVWGPLGWGRLTGKLRRGQPLPQHSRLHATAVAGPAIDDARLFAIIDALDVIAAETGRNVPQIAINWLLQRPTVSTVLIGARHEVQLRDNLGAVGWSLTEDQRARLDRVSAVEPPYPHAPYWRGQFAERRPTPLEGRLR